MSTLLCNTWPRMTFPSIFSGVITGTVGVGLMGLAVFNEDTSMVYGMMALVGVGLGMGLMAGPLHTVGIFRNNRAPVIGLMAITIPFGGTVGLTIMTTVFNNVSKFGADTDFSTLRDLPKDEQQMAVHLAKVSTRETSAAENVANYDADGHCLGLCCHHTLPTICMHLSKLTWTRTPADLPHRLAAVPLSLEMSSYPKNVEGAA